MLLRPACVLLARRHLRKGLACTHLTPQFDHANTRENRLDREKQEKNQEPPGTDTGPQDGHQSCVHHQGILQFLSRNSIHHFCDIPRAHLHMQVHCTYTHSDLPALLSPSRLGIAQCAPQLARHYLHLNGFLCLVSSLPIRPLFLICLVLCSALSSGDHFPRRVTCWPVIQDTLTAWSRLFRPSN